VVTLPIEGNARIVVPALSATYKMPAPSMTMPVGSRSGQWLLCVLLPWNP